MHNNKYSSCPQRYHSLKGRPRGWDTLGNPEEGMVLFGLGEWWWLYLIINEKHASCEIHKKVGF